MKEQDFAQEIKQMLEQMDTNVVQPELDLDIELMPKNQEVTPPASPDPEAKKFPSNQGDTEILEDNLEVDVHNISFEESQHIVVQSHRVPTLNVHVSPVHFQERVIVSDVHRHPTTLADATSICISH